MKHISRDNKGQFTKGHKLSIGNKGGRPRFFETPEDFQKAVDSYSDTISHKDKDGRRVYTQMPTLSSLPAFFGCSKETIRATVSRSAKYSDLYNVYKSVCEYHLEKALYSDISSVHGVIFTLRRHFGYSIDKYNDT